MKTIESAMYQFELKFWMMHSVSLPTYLDFGLVSLHKQYLRCMAAIPQDTLGITCRVLDLFLLCTYYVISFSFLSNADEE